LSGSSFSEHGNSVVTREGQLRELITLVLADAQPLTLEGLCRLFEKEQNCAVLAACGDADAVLDALSQHAPSVLVLDIDLPRNGAFTILRQLQRESVPTYAVLLATALADDRVLDAVRLGVRGVILKAMSPELMVQCVRAVHAGQRWPEEQVVPPSLSGLLNHEVVVRHAARGLTSREIEVVRLAIRGVPTKDIAERLAVKRGTIKVHLHNIYDKLQVDGRLGLILFARRQGLV
jgi:DNA-binding NarL/FixJ family response regulator